MDSEKWDLLLDFPCDHVFKVFACGENRDEFTRQVHGAVNRITSVPLDAVKVKDSSGGRYCCVSVVVRVVNSTQVISIYSELKSLDGIKYLL